MDPPYDLLASSQLTATDKAAHSADIVAGRARPMRLRKRSRERSWTLSRFATDECRMPSSLLSGTSVDRPRMVEVTGATITEWRSRPKGGIGGEDDEGTGGQKLASG